MRLTLSIVALSAFLLCGCSHAMAPAILSPSLDSVAPGKIKQASSPRNFDATPLLYAALSNKHFVAVYSYPQGKLLMSVRAPRPNGLCSDTQGNVFVVDFLYTNVIEYAYGNSRQMKILRDGNPTFSCAVDPVTNSLAVTNYCDSASVSASGCGYGHGSISIFKGEKGPAKVVQLKNVTYAEYCTYDTKGNLFVDGSPNGHGFELAEIPDGRSEAVAVNLNFKPKNPGALQWSNGQLAVGDQFQTVYRYTVSGNAAKKVGTTVLEGGNGVAGFWIDGTTLVGPNLGGTTVALWKYPVGGRSFKTIRTVTGPFAVTISR
jgi:hypothetical protein